jgi:hypothetical protein
VKPILRQFCTLMAGANFEQKQVRELLSLISKTSPQQLYAEIDSIRSQFSPEARRTGHVTEEPSDQFSARIADLLINEANFTKIEAHQLLGLGLKHSFPDRVLPLFSSKAGFMAWIRSLRKMYTDSELLHVATRLRNERVHGLGVKDDWLHRGTRE